MRPPFLVPTLLLAATLAAGCAPGDAAPAGEAAAAAAAKPPSGPSAGDREFARLTASWSPAALEACAAQLRDVLGTRDLVQGALDGVDDPGGRAKAEVEDARRWIQEGDRRFAEVEPKLEAGACDGSVTIALDESWQFYVKAGTSAVQAGQIGGAGK